MCDLQLKNVEMTEDLQLMIDQYNELGDMFLQEDYAKTEGANFEKVWTFLQEIEKHQRVFCMDHSHHFLYCNISFLIYIVKFYYLIISDSMPSKNKIRIETV